MKSGSTNLEWRLVIGLSVIMLLLTGGLLAHTNIGQLMRAADVAELARTAEATLDDDAAQRLRSRRQSHIRRAYRWAIAAVTSLAALGLLAAAAYLHLLHEGLLVQQKRQAGMREDLFRTRLGSIGDAVIATDRFGRVTFLNSVAEEQTDSPAPIRDAQGRTSAAVLVFHDISDAKRLEEQFRQSQKMEAVGRLAGGIAHDFNNLLTVINGYCQLVESDPSMSQNSRDYLAEIHRAGDRAAALTEQLLAFSRSKLLAPTLIDLNEVIASTSNLLKPLIGEDIAMHVDLASELWNIRADRGQMEQILINFAVNARDAMSDGGEILVRTSNVNVAPTTLKSPGEAVDGQYVMLAFQDTGTGMDESVRTRIFEPYFTTKEQGKGTGLGLATVFAIVQQSDGFVDVCSQPGAGTTFNVYFPRA